MLPRFTAVARSLSLASLLVAGPIAALELPLPPPGEDIVGLLAPYDELVKKISPAMIQDAAKKYFDTKNYARFVLLPENAPPKP